MNQGINILSSTPPWEGKPLFIPANEFGLLCIDIYSNCCGFLQWGGGEKQEDAELKKVSTLTFRAPPGEKWLNESKWLREFLSNNTTFIFIAPFFSSGCFGICFPVLFQRLRFWRVSGVRKRFIGDEAETKWDEIKWFICQRAVLILGNSSLPLGDEMSVWIAMRGQSFGPLQGSLQGCHASIEIAVTTSLLPLIPEPINLQQMNQVAARVKHYKNRVPRFSVQRSKNPFVFCRLEMKGSRPACHFCVTNVRSY